MGLPYLKMLVFSGISLKAYLLTTHQQRDAKAFGYLLFFIKSTIN